MSKSVLVPIADGTEEIEAVTVIDVLRRAEAQVTVASVEARRQITASRGVRIVADCLIGDCIDTSFDLVVLPGGMPGAEHLRDSDDLKAILLEHVQQGGSYAAICAAPAVVLAPHGLLAGKNATCYPSFAERLRGSMSLERVVADHNCITSRGPGTAMEFALELVALLFGKAKAEAVAGPMLAQGYGQFQGRAILEADGSSGGGGA
jgi:4-methyl-5(b-hydroxyethyl)-thiazole monophosphate biosynthesis